MASHDDAWIARPSVARAIGLLLTLSAVIPLVLGRFAYPQAQLAFFSDDFFYYAQIAKNIVFHGTSTWDGATLTNGYHPLWLLVLMSFWRMGGERYFIPLVTIATALAALLVFLLVFELCRQFRVYSLVALVISLWAAGAFLVVAGGGMEAILSIPLGLTALLYLNSSRFHWSWQQCFTLGLLVSLAVLARIDTIILFSALMVLLLLLDRNPLVEWAKRLGLMAAGAFPLYIYLIVNEAIFGQLSPISGTAKSLKIGLHFDPIGLTWTLGAIRSPKAL